MVEGSAVRAHLEEVMKCPVCVDPTLTMSERQGVEIDYCPQCRGIWLDRGELDKLLERAATEFAAASAAAPAPAAPAPVPAAAPAPAPRYDEPRYQEPRYQEPRYDDRKYDDRYDSGYAKKRKKKSFLDDILDF
jgi:Zn-finger nucleic acid-binding protein